MAARLGIDWIQYVLLGCLFHCFQQVQYLFYYAFAVLSIVQPI